jgi:hypothetical protein
MPRLVCVCTLVPYLNVARMFYSRKKKGRLARRAFIPPLERVGLRARVFCQSCFVPSGIVTPSSDSAWASCSSVTLAPLSTASLRAAPPK